MIEPLVHPGHVHRRPDGTFFHHEHPGRGRFPHGHHKASYVRDVRTCPKCFGRMVMVRSGKDDRGRFEVWRCLSRIAGIPGVSPPGWVGQCELKWENARTDQDGLVGIFRLEPNEIALRDGDYDRAALARAKASR